MTRPARRDSSNPSIGTRPRRPQKSTRPIIPRLPPSAAQTMPQTNLGSYLGNRLSKWLPGRLAVATIISNGLFGFETGLSIAAAAAFSRIAYPEMRRYGYRRDF